MSAVFLRGSCLSDDAARAAGVASADQRHGVVQGHRGVWGAELVRVVVGGRRGRKRGLRAVPLSHSDRRGQGRLDELVCGRTLAKEGLHASSSALVHHDRSDYQNKVDLRFKRWCLFNP